jgi:fructose-bisphosphate aldolase, class II
MIVTTAQLFKIAYGNYAVGAYNINNMEQALGLFEGHIQAQAPFIVQLSKGARKYANPRVIEAIIRAVEAEYPEAIFAVHLDHGDEQTAYECIDSGFYSSVMIDASHEPFEKTWPSPAASSSAPTPGASASRRSWACWAASKKTSRSTRSTPC